MKKLAELFYSVSVEVIIRWNQFKDWLWPPPPDPYAGNEEPNIPEPPE